jgi:hypothetical protein
MKEHLQLIDERHWIPAFAGMTILGQPFLKCHPGESRDPVSLIYPRASGN